MITRLVLSKRGMFLGLLFYLMPLVSAYSIDITAVNLAKQAYPQASLLLPGCRLESTTTYFGFHETASAFSLTFKSSDGRFLNLLLAADDSSDPVISYGYRSDPEKARMPAYLRIAEKYMADPRLRQSYYFGFQEIWHLFSQKNDSIYLCTCPATKPLSPAAFRAHVNQLDTDPWSPRRGQSDAGLVAERWRRLAEGTLLNPGSFHYIPHAEDVPDFEWHFGCTPTAAADLLGYYDVVYGYGNMITHFFRDIDTIQKRIVSGDTIYYWDETVPDLSSDLAFLMKTKPKTGATVDAELGKHLAEAAWWQDISYNATDYGLDVLTPWSRLKTEVDAGYPCILSGDLPGDDGFHSMCLVGYSENPDQIAVYEINYPGITYHNKDYLHFCNVAWVHLPQVHRGNGITLTTLRGVNTAPSPSTVLTTSEVFTIRWQCDRPGDGKVTIQINKDGGVGNWSTLTELNNNPGEWDWLPTSSHIGVHNRIRVQWFSLEGTQFGGDGSLSDFEVQGGTLQKLSDGSEFCHEWPDALACGYQGNQWGVAAIQQEDPVKTNTLQFYPDTTFNTVIAQDVVGKSAGRTWGMCGVNVGPPNPPPGPFGIQVLGDGDGCIEYVESEELSWGANALTGSFTSNSFVKAYHFYIDAQDKALLYKTQIHLENTSSKNLDLYLFDTSKRYFAYGDAILTANNPLAGGDETMTIPAGASGRMLLVISKSGYGTANYILSLTNESYAAQLSGIEMGSSRTLGYSGLVMPVTLDEAGWHVAGILPLQNSEWALAVADERSFANPLANSRWYSPVTNLVVMRKEASRNDSLFLRPSRLAGAGAAHLELSRILKQPPLHDGKNPNRTWPAGKAFLLLPIIAGKPLISLIVEARAVDGPPVFCGIVPDSGNNVYSTSMLWGGSLGNVEGNQDIKTGAVVFWTTTVPQSPFQYSFSTQLLTGVERATQQPSSCRVAVYPNPFNENTCITGISLHVDASSLEIYDLLGRAQAVPMMRRGEALMLDMRGFPAGIYFLRNPHMKGEVYRLIKLRR